MARASKPSKRRAKAPPRRADPDPTKAPRYTRWATAQPKAQGFDAGARARLVQALAAHGRLGLAVAIARVSDSTVARWRKAGATQLREIEKHEQAQDRREAEGLERLPYLGAREAADFVLEIEGARGWWEAQHQCRLQQAAEAETQETGFGTTMYLLNRHDRLTGAVKGSEVHEHHHHTPPSAVGKLEETVARRRALRGSSG